MTLTTEFCLLPWNVDLDDRRTVNERTGRNADDETLAQAVNWRATTVTRDKLSSLVYALPPPLYLFYSPSSLLRDKLMSFSYP